MIDLGPYEPNNIYCGECANLMADLPDDCIDLTVTSPPYDNLRTYNGYTFDFEAIAQQLYRVTKPGGVVVWVVADATINGSETLTSFRQAIYFKDVCGFNVHDTMIYEVAGTGAKGSNEAYWQAFEFMIVLSKGRPKTVNKLRDKINTSAGLRKWRSPKQDRLNTRTNRPDETKRLGIRTNIWRYLTGFLSGDDVTEFSAPFPEALARDHIISWSNPGDLIFDPMCGSGTTCKMAKEQGRQWLGFDISQEYCELAQQRVEGAKVPLFVETEARQPEPEQLVIGL